MKTLKTLPLIVGLCLTALATFGQNESDSTQGKKNVDVMFGVGGGVTKFLGDIEDGKTTNVHLFGNRPAVDVYIGANLSRSFTLYVNGIYGKLSGNENTTRSNRNFESEMFQAGIGVEYNFAGLYKNRLPVVSPFINAGGYYSNYFNVSTDLKDRDGQLYYYWSDGRIRNQQEAPQNENTAENMVRDFKYETSLVDGSVHSFAASAGGGLDLHLSKAFSIRFMSRYFFSFSDKVDGFDNKEVSKWNDGFFFTSISLMVNTTAFDPNRKEEEPVYKYLFDFSKLDEEDGDGDGIVDLKDLCAGTPEGVSVDENGCPLDSDLDGIPDHRDQDDNSPEGAIVDQNGVAVDYELIASKTDSGGVFRIQWDKKYLRPRDPDSETFTVQVGEKSKLDQDSVGSSFLSLPELRQVKINDSLTIFYLGKFKKFDEADAKKRELVSKGLNNAYGVREESATQVSADLVELERRIGANEPTKISSSASAGITNATPEADQSAESIEPESRAAAEPTGNVQKPKEVKVTSAPVVPEFRAADTDGDGLISANEIEKVLEGILEGDTTFSTEQFNAITTYYTEFTENADPIDFGGTKVVYVDGVMTILTTEDGEMSENSRRLLARKYVETDFNGDGQLTPDEVQQMIHMFRMGESPYSDKKIHELIDLYFD